MLDSQRIPGHVAIIMDGNGRWAEKKNLPRVAGHNAGMLAMKEIVKRSSVLGVKHLTVYAFSTENWKRSTEEVSGIFKLLVFYVSKELAELHRENVRIHILGDYSKLPEDALKAVENAIATTKNNTGLKFNIALNYGSRNEIKNAVQSIGRDIKEGLLSPEEITEELIGSKLETGIAGIPDPDLLIRTSGEERISNYLLWQIAYTELYVTPVLWPDFRRADLYRAILDYQRRERRFGGITQE